MRHKRGEMEPISFILCVAIILADLELERRRPFHDEDTVKI